MTVETLVSPSGYGEPMEAPELPATIASEEEEGLSEYGRAALGLAIGAVLWRGLDMPGGLIVGGIAGALVGYFLPPMKGGSDGG